MATDYNQATQDALNEQKKQLTQQIGQFGSAANSAIQGGNTILQGQQNQAISEAARRAALVGGPEAQSSVFTNPINAAYNEGKSGLSALGSAIQQQLGSYKDIYNRYLSGVQGLAGQAAANPSSGLSNDEIRTRAYGAGTIASQQQADQIAQGQKDAATLADKAQKDASGNKTSVQALQNQLAIEQKQLKEAQAYQKAKGGGVTAIPGQGVFNSGLNLPVKKPADIPTIDPVGKLSKIIAQDQQRLTAAQVAQGKKDAAVAQALKQVQTAGNKTADTPAQAAIKAAIAHGVSPDVAVGLFADTATKEGKAATKAQYDVSPREGTPTINDIAGGTKLDPADVSKAVNTNEFNKASDEILKNAESGDATKADFNKAIAKYAKKNPNLYKVLKYSYSGYFG